MPSAPKRPHFPVGMTRAQVSKGRVCPRCEKNLTSKEFDDGQRLCRKCNAEAQQEHEDEPARLKARELLERGAGATLDGFLDAVMSALGGEGAFAVMCADQIKQGFNKFPGRASNLTAMMSLMKVMGMRDQNKIQRDMADLNLEELHVAKQELAMTLFQEVMDDETKISFANQLLESTGELALPVTIDGESSSNASEAEAVSEDREGDSGEGMRSSPDLPPADDASGVPFEPSE